MSPDSGEFAFQAGEKAANIREENGSGEGRDRSGGNAAKPGGGVRRQSIRSRAQVTPRSVGGLKAGRLRRVTARSGGKMAGLCEVILRDGSAESAGVLFPCLSPSGSGSVGIRPGRRPDFGGGGMLSGYVVGYVVGVFLTGSGRR